MTWETMTEETLRDRVEVLKSGAISLAALCAGGVAVEAFVRELASRQAETKALAKEVEKVLADQIVQLGEVNAELRAKRAEQALAAGQVIQLREQIAHEKAKLVALSREAVR
jgi:hypothetical protein